MNYRQFGRMDYKPSALGFGCMRLPTTDGDPNSKHIDEKQAIDMIRYAIDHGVNYVDTAYYYHDSASEGLVGKALLDGYRERTKVATKSPVYALEKPEDFDRILDEQLARLQTDHIDFYLLHSLSLNTWNNVVLRFDLLSKMERAKASGKIDKIGFSFHDEYDAFQTMVDGYDKWDFCQIQLNYIDIAHQAGVKGLEYAASKGLGVIIMEPLLGGKLANPAKNVAQALSPEKTPVEWALDFLWNRPEVGLILSGMHDHQQIEQNIAYASRAQVGMLKQADLDMLAQAKTIYDTMALVPCTKCAYCMPCPFGLNIPAIFEAYNSTVSSGMEKAQALYAQLETKADACKACRRCERACPQHIEVSAQMPEIGRVFSK